MRFLSLGAALLVFSGCIEKAPRYPKAPVIIVSIDTLRADHLPAYGYRDVETPAIDRLRRDSILFENAYSHVPLTLPSHISMLTGELPAETGVRDNIGYAFDAARHETIASVLRKHGYVTGAAVSAYVLRGSTGIGNAFEFYDDAVEVRGEEAQGELQRAGALTEASAERWIAKQGERPFFFLLHLFEPHSPYTPPEPFRSRFKLPYDGEIATADAIVGKFIDFLEERKIYDRAIVILMSDHGEGLMQHGEQEHGIFLYREALHVPLLLKLPRNERANRSVNKPVGLIDIFPTVASLVGIEVKKPHAISLLSGDGKSQYAETIYPRIHLGLSDLRSLIDKDHHLIQAPKPELYDFSRDAEERKNIVDSERRVYDSMKKELKIFSGGMQPPSRIDPEEAKKLAALGYLTSSSSATGPLPDPKDYIGEIATLQDAARREARGDVGGAIAGYRTVVSQNPNFTDAWILLAKAQEKAGKYAEAIESYKHAIQLAPKLSGTVVSLAQALTVEHRYGEAMQLIDSLRGEAVPLADFVRGDLLARNGRPEEAKALFVREIRNFPAERQPYASLAVLYWLEGNRAAAKQTLDSFVQANPSRASLLFAAKTVGELGDRASAAAYKTRAAAAQ
jgi:arylsulfatase A-like enzyme/Tfp pilus assembly protein PilF